ncbi:MAG: hypothetical protein WKG01_33310 [Kofleriaceae bacterium]
MSVRLLVIVLLGACEPTQFDGTAFKCQVDGACPDDQACFGGRCRTAPAVSIACGEATCGPDQQCCADQVNGNRCIPAVDDCVGAGALCDGRDDCALTETCCIAELTSCAERCETAACVISNDCPSASPNCCPQEVSPWGRCQLAPC